MGDLKDCYQTKNVGFISTRLAGTDGVSLETKKWADVFEFEGYKSFYFAGKNSIVSGLKQHLVIVDACSRWLIT